MNTKEKKALKVPTVHLNGTSGKVLYEQYIAVGRSLGLTLRAMEEASPNARDYYVQGEGAYAEAMKEHMARVDVLRGVGKEIDTIMEALFDAIHYSD